MVKIKTAKLSPKMVQVISALGARVRAERKARKLNQQQLADLAGVGINFVSQLEGGKATAHIGRVVAVLQVLGLQLDLVRGKEGLRVL